MARMSALFLLVCACVCVAAAPVPRPPAPHPPSNTNCTPVGFVVVQPVAIFTTDQPIRITALASLFINCGRAPQIMWSVGTFTRQGPTLVLAASSLAAGDYVATVKMLDESSTIASAQVAITIIDAQPTIAIVGGDRTTDATQPIAFLAQVSTVTSVQWSACLLDGSGQCASNSPKFKFMQLDTPFTSAAVLSTGFKTIGMVQVTATAIGASAASRASASVNVNVISADVNTVIIRSTTPRDVLPGFPVAVVALASQPFSTFNWTTSDGSTATGPFATFFPRSVGTFTVSVTASGLNGGLAGNASYAFNVGQLPSATCSISSTDAVVSGGESPITIQLDSWRAGNRDGGFRFGIRTLNGFVSLSPDFSEFTNLTAVAPLVAGDGVISIELQTKIAGAIATAAKCDINVTAPSNISEILDARASLLKSAILAADTATSLRSAFDIASVTLGMATNQYNVTGALADLVNSAAAFTSTEKGSAVDILDLALTSLTNIGEETQANIVTVLSRLINTTDGVILDFATRAQTVAGLISQLDPNNLPANRTAKKQLAQQLAVGIASQLALGASANITSGSISITATKLPATQVSAGGAFNASGGSGSIAVPLGALASALNMSVEDVALFNADVAVSATVHSSNPVPTASVEGGKALSGAIVEFDVTATGANFGSGLSVAITVGVRSSPKGTCVYFDTTANAWSTAGVTTVGYDASTGQLLCNTTHLSMFSASVDIAGVTKAPAPVSSSSAPTAPFTTAPAATTVIQNSTGAASDDTTSSSSSGLSPTAIGVIAAVAVLLLVAGVLAVIAISKLKRRRNEASTSNPSKRAELYATSVEMSATIGQSTSDKDEHTASRPPIKATDLNFSQV